MRTLLLVLVLLSSPVLAGEVLRGRVVGVQDGDTLTLLESRRQQHRIRLHGIDAPESAQAFGTRAKQSLSELAFGKDTEVEAIDQDRYGRIVGKVRVGEIDVNAEQVRRGFAWVYRKYTNDPDLLRLEEEARDSRRGLWADPNPIPPWEFRRNEKHAGHKTTATELQREGSGFTCGTKRRCSQMASCAEAMFYSRHCGLSRLDRDHDGIPCEAICR